MSVLDALRRELGDAVSTDSELLETARADKSGYVSPSPPLAHVTARTIADVQATLRIAHEHSVPVVTRGAGTGLAGGATARGGEIVLSTLGLNRIVDVSLTDEIAVVEAGVINGDLNDHLAPLGYWYAPDPAIRAISTIGGNIATNAGGLLCAKYGVTREAVLGLTVVLADGTVMRLGRRSIKGVTGLDLTALMIGSEGTLGVIVEATVRIRPRPRATPVTIAAWFDSADTALAACAAITAHALAPAILELIDASGVRAIAALLASASTSGHLLAPRPDMVHVVVQLDTEGAAADSALVTNLVAEHGGVASSTTDPVEAERLLAVRRSFHPALERHGTVLIEDVCVPRSALPAMFREITRIENEFALSIPTVAHVGDGNLHPNFIINAASGIDTVPDDVWLAAGELFHAALRVGGTLTGEHGVGLLKQRWLGDELEPTNLSIQRSIKALFDPHGILNPGKVF